MQLLAVELGGTLYQDIATEVPGALEHGPPNNPKEGGHPARILPGTDLAAIVGVPELSVNSTHHQAVKDPGRAKVSRGGARSRRRGHRAARQVRGRGPVDIPKLMPRRALALYRALVERARR